MRSLAFLAVAVLAHTVADFGTEATERKHHHHKHHHKHGHKSDVAASTATAASSKVTAQAASSKVNATAKVVATVSHASKANATATQTQAQVLAKMKSLETELNAKETAAAGQIQRGRLHVNGPLPADFQEVFGQAVAKATGCVAQEVNIVDRQYADATHRLVTLDFEAPLNVVHAVEDQAADPYSKISNGVLRPFLVAGGSSSFVAQAASVPGAPEHSLEFDDSGDGAQPAAFAAAPVQLAAANGADSDGAAAGPEPCAPNIDIDTDMPYGELEPFGREDTAQELTEQSITESDEMVDQLERAEVAEEKRSVFRALTRLRGAAITSFDGIARSQTGNIDEYNKVHKWRMTHPLRHLADEESDISKWAFPDNADF